jgi:hypothetical protein
MVGGILCDLEQAFNYVNEEILLCKLDFCGVKVKLTYDLDHISVIDIRGS